MTTRTAMALGAAATGDARNLALIFAELDVDRHRRGGDGHEAERERSGQSSKQAHFPLPFESASQDAKRLKRSGG
jgi:hypothetical protein